MKKIIEFSSPLKGYIPEPKPSLHFIPEAYKEMPGIIKNEFSPTVKKCIPFLDAFTSGYIIPFQTDIQFMYDKKNNNSKFMINDQLPNEFINFLNVGAHPSTQISEELRSSKRTIDEILKFNNSWTIKTPSGYSCLFITPFNHSLPFELITGVVDTDSYQAPVNFPFYWTANPEEDFTLQQGSPMVMVFPFKRDDWKMKTKFISEDLKKLKLKRVSFFSKIVDNYKKLSWKKKSYR